MRRLIALLGLVALVALGAFVAPAPAGADAADGPLNWPAILGRADVNGDGTVSAGDILKIVNRFGTTVEKDAGGSYVPGPGYLTLYDVDGGGAVSVGDILRVVLDFGLPAPLIDRQVAQATLAMMGEYGGPDLRDPSQAVAAGFIQSSQDVPGMGIHMFNPDYIAAWPTCCTLYDPNDPATESQLIHPPGLVYTQGPGGGPDKLIGAWYLHPNDEVCAFYSLPAPCQSNSIQPVGFGLTNTDEDNENPPGILEGWHVHPGLCVWDWGTASANVAQDVPEGDCVGTGGVWFSTYAWMMHLYNFFPNPEGRFINWNFQNVP